MYHALITATMYKGAEFLFLFVKKNDSHWISLKGAIVPLPGINEEYDAAAAEVSGVRARLAEYLTALKKQLKCTAISCKCALLLSSFFFQIKQTTT